MQEQRTPELHAQHPQTGEWRRWGYVRLDFPGEEEFYLWDDMTIRIYRYPDNRPKRIILRDLGPVEAVNAELLGAAKAFCKRCKEMCVPFSEMRELEAAIARAEARNDAAPPVADKPPDLEERVTALERDLACIGAHTVSMSRFENLRDRVSEVLARIAALEKTAPFKATAVFTDYTGNGGLCFRCGDSGADKTCTAGVCPQCGGKGWVTP